MRFEGVIKTWNEGRGFGFIEPRLGGQEIFVHISAINRTTGRPSEGQIVTFEVEPGPQGKKRAKNVEVFRTAKASPKRTGRWNAPGNASTLLAIPAFLILYLIVSLVWSTPPLLGIIYALASLFTFFVYAQDKSAARRGAWRTPESTLHLLALAGGWPGALLARHFLRHKSSKPGFRLIFWCTVIVNVLALIALSSPVGRQFVQMR